MATAVASNMPDVDIALFAVDAEVVTGFRIGPGWNQDADRRRVYEGALFNGTIDGGLVISTVRRHRAEPATYWRE